MRLPLPIALLPALLAPSASAQLAFQHVRGAFADHLGYDVDFVGDIDGDGRDDWIVGGPGESTGTKPGRARVLSGADGALIYELVGDHDGSWFGGAVAGLGDVDGDGVPDFAVGAASDDTVAKNGGLVRVFSGADGAVLLELRGREGAFLGSSVDGVGDLDGDGHADVLAGGPYDDTNGHWSGMAGVWSGADGSEIHTYFGHASDRLGLALAGLGDTEGDGVRDLAIYTQDLIIVYSGATGGALLDIPMPQGAIGWGQSVAGTGDLTGDGRADLLIGAWADYTAGPAYGGAYVVSGADGSIWMSVHGDVKGAYFGYAVANAGDVDGDGVPDLIVGAPAPAYQTSIRGHVRVFSGSSGSELYRIPARAFDDYFGFSVAGGGDANRDGVGDLAIGASMGNTPLAKGAGELVLLGAGFLGEVTCGPGPKNTAGHPGELVLLGSAAVADDDLTVAAVHLPEGAPAHLLASRSADLVFKTGGVLCLGKPVFRLTLGVATTGGVVQRALTLGDFPAGIGHAVAPGETWHFQCWYADAGEGKLTDARALTFR